MSYRYQLVDRIPRQMQEGIVYHSEEFGLAGLLCACGCGHRVTLIVPDSHQVFDDGGYATITPSVGVMDSACKSHFIVRAGQIRWFPPFSDAHAARVMHAQIASHMAREPLPTWWQQMMAAVMTFVQRLQEVFKR